MSDDDPSEHAGRERQCPACGHDRFRLWHRTDLPELNEPTTVVCAGCGNSIGGTSIKDPRMTDPESPLWEPTDDRVDRIRNLYDLMCELSQTHGARDARLEYVDSTTAAVVLEFETPEIPADDAEDDDG